MNINFMQLMKMQHQLLDGLFINQYFERDKYVMYISNIIKDTVWNFVVTENLSQNKVELIEDEFKCKNRNSCIYISDSSENFEVEKQILINNKYKLLDIDSYMFLEKLNDVIKVKHSCKVVDSDELAEDFIEVLNNAYAIKKEEEDPYGGVVDETYEEVIRKSVRSRNKKFHHIVLYDKDEPISCVTLAYKDGMAAIYNVGTKREKQQRGYGSEIIKFAILKFESLGGKLLYLDTEDFSKNKQWYEKIGFKPMMTNYQYVKDLLYRKSENN